MRLSQQSRVSLSLALAASVVLVAFPSAPEAATFYVDQSHPSASDSNAGTSESAPWLTLQRAMSVVAGDVVLVKNGTYLAPATGNPAFVPANSGTAGNPIAFRAFTPGDGSARHRPVVARANPFSPNGLNFNVIHVNGQDHIVWDGFQTQPFTTVRVEGTTGTVIENMLIDVGVAPSTGGIDNYNGIFVQLATGVVIRNNVIRNVRYAGDVHHNAAAIVLFDVNGIRIHNNEISHSNTAIYDKENGVNNVYEHNYIHDILGDALFYTGFSTSRCAATGCPVQDDILRFNVIVNANVGVRYNLGANASNLHVHNNTMFNVVAGTTHDFATPPGHRAYNNIVVIRPSAGGQHYGISTASPAGFVSDFNCFRSTEAPLTTTRFFVVDHIETLAQWQARGFDANSVTVDPLFVGPLAAATPPVAAFRLQADSPLRTAGRTGGTAGGSQTAVGAFVTDGDVIGAGIPTAPTDLRVQ